ncbi:uncharacterized protein LOC128928764 [Callithrix jacchus]
MLPCVNRISYIAQQIDTHELSLQSPYWQEAVTGCGLLTLDFSASLTAPDAISSSDLSPGGQSPQAEFSRTFPGGGSADCGIKNWKAACEKIECNDCCHLLASLFSTSASSFNPVLSMRNHCPE